MLVAKAQGNVQVADKFRDEGLAINKPEFEACVKRLQFVREYAKKSARQ